MKESYGYTDGSGDWYVTIDTDRCDGCSKCVETCPEDVYRVEFDDYDELKAVVVEEHRKRIEETCRPCKPTAGGTMEPCRIACPLDAISLSW
ncbi:MAG: 4Fe-4S binding protein [Planctomycetota bacterium]|jgi:ferredoxin